MLQGYHQKEECCQTIFEDDERNDFNMRRINDGSFVTEERLGKFGKELQQAILSSIKGVMNPNKPERQTMSLTISGESVRKIDLCLAPTRRFFPASGLCLSLPNISCVGLRQVKQRNELSHFAFLMRSIASLLLKHKHVYALL